MTRVLFDSNKRAIGAEYIPTLTLTPTPTTTLILTLTPTLTLTLAIGAEYMRGRSPP